MMEGSWPQCAAQSESTLHYSSPRVQPHRLLSLRCASPRTEPQLRGRHLDSFNRSRRSVDTAECAPLCCIECTPPWHLVDVCSMYATGPRNWAAGRFAKAEASAVGSTITASLMRAVHCARKVDLTALGGGAISLSPAGHCAALRRFESASDIALRALSGAASRCVVLPSCLVVPSLFLLSAPLLVRCSCCACEKVLRWPPPQRATVIRIRLLVCE